MLRRRDRQQSHAAPPDVDGATHAQADWLSSQQDGHGEPAAEGLGPGLSRAAADGGTGLWTCFRGCFGRASGGLGGAAPPTHHSHSSGKHGASSSKQALPGVLHSGASTTTIKVPDARTPHPYRSSTNGPPSHSHLLSPPGPPATPFTAAVNASFTARATPLRPSASHHLSNQSSRRTLRTSLTTPTGLQQRASGATEGHAGVLPGVPLGDAAARRASAGGSYPAGGDRPLGAGLDTDLLESSTGLPNHAFSQPLPRLLATSSRVTPSLPPLHPWSPSASMQRLSMPRVSRGSTLALAMGNGAEQDVPPLHGPESSSTLGTNTTVVTVAGLSLGWSSSARGLGQDLLFDDFDEQEEEARAEEEECRVATQRSLGALQVEQRRQGQPPARLAPHTADGTPPPQQQHHHLHRLHGHSEGGAYDGPPPSAPLPVARKRTSVVRWALPEHSAASEEPQAPLHLQGVLPDGAVGPPSSPPLHLQSPMYAARATEGASAASGAPSPSSSGWLSRLVSGGAAAAAARDAPPSPSWVDRLLPRRTSRVAAVSVGPGPATTSSGGAAGALSPAPSHGTTAPWSASPTFPRSYAADHAGAVAAADAPHPVRHPHLQPPGGPGKGLPYGPVTAPIPTTTLDGVGKEGTPSPATSAPLPASLQVPPPHRESAPGTLQQAALAGGGDDLVADADVDALPPQPRMRLVSDTGFFRAAGAQAAPPGPHLMQHAASMPSGAARAAAAASAAVTMRTMSGPGSRSRRGIGFAEGTQEEDGLGGRAGAAAWRSRNTSHSNLSTGGGGGGGGVAAYDMHSPGSHQRLLLSSGGGGETPGRRVTRAGSGSLLEEDNEAEDRPSRTSRKSAHPAHRAGELGGEEGSSNLALLLDIRRIRRQGQQVLVRVKSRSRIHVELPDEAAAGETDGGPEAQRPGGGLLLQRAPSSTRRAGVESADEGAGLGEEQPQGGVGSPEQQDVLAARRLLTSTSMRGGGGGGARGGGALLLIKPADESKDRTLDVASTLSTLAALRTRRTAAAAAAAAAENGFGSAPSWSSKPSATSRLLALAASSSSSSPAAGVASSHQPHARPPPPPRVSGSGSAASAAQGVGPEPGAQPLQPATDDARPQVDGGAQRQQAPRPAASPRRSKSLGVPRLARMEQNGQQLTGTASLADGSDAGPDEAISHASSSHAPSVAGVGGGPDISPSLSPAASSGRPSKLAALKLARQQRDAAAAAAAAAAAVAAAASGLSSDA